MASKNTNGKPAGKGQNTAVKQDKASSKPPLGTRDFFDKMDLFFEKRLNFFLWFGLIFTVLFSFLLFDIRVTPGGDDSTYISRAFEFVHEFKYPSYQGPLYPMVLSPFIALFGINLPLLKSLSVIFLAIGAWLFFKAFRNRIPSTLLVFTFFLLSFNYYMLYFGSQTYNEAFFVMLQAMLFLVMGKFFVTDEPVTAFKPYVWLGFVLFLMCNTKSVAFAALAAVLGYFLFTGKWKSIVLTMGGFLTFFIPWEILKRIIWKTAGLQFSNQATSLMYKDFYNPTKGNEDFVGFLQRILDNSNLYLSKHFFKFLGLRPEVTGDPPMPIEIAPILTFFTVVIFVAAFIMVFRKNKMLLLTGIYIGSMLLASFIILQKQWDQWRLIIIYFPLMLLFTFTAFYYLFKKPDLKSFQFVLPGLLVLFFFTSFGVTSKNVTVQQEIISKNLKGNYLYGWTPDWQNFILMSKWAGENVPKDYQIASRKVDISFIYGQRKFYPIYKVPNSTLDSILKPVKDSSSYVIVHIKKLAESTERGDLPYRSYLKGYVAGTFSMGGEPEDDSNYVGIYCFPSRVLTEMKNDPKIKGKVEIVDDARAWVTDLMKKNADIAIYDPDYLYDLLKKNKVKYALLASLRLNPNVNDGNIITTLHRYLFFIQLKYPDVLKEVNKIGTEETCSLVEIKID